MLTNSFSENSNFGTSSCGELVLSTRAY